MSQRLSKQLRDADAHCDRCLARGKGLGIGRSDIQRWADEAVALEHDVDIQTEISALLRRLGKDAIRMLWEVFLYTEDRRTEDRVWEWLESYGLTREVDSRELKSWSQEELSQVRVRNGKEYVLRLETVSEQEYLCCC